MAIDLAFGPWPAQLARSMNNEAIAGAVESQFERFPECHRARLKLSLEIEGDE